MVRLTTLATTAILMIVVFSFAYSHSVLLPSTQELEEKQQDTTKENLVHKHTPLQRPQSPRSIKKCDPFEEPDLSKWTVEDLVKFVVANHGNDDSVPTKAIKEKISEIKKLEKVSLEATTGENARHSIVAWVPFKNLQESLDSHMKSLREVFTKQDVIEVTATMPLLTLVKAVSRSKIIIIPSPSSHWPHSFSHIPQLLHSTSTVMMEIAPSNVAVVELFVNVTHSDSQSIPSSFLKIASNYGLEITPTEEKFLMDTIKNVTIDNRPKVMVISLPRSGSSFVGKIFGANEDFIYLFEPAHYSWPQNDPCVWGFNHTSSPKAEDLWREVYRCDFRNVDSYNQKQSWPPSAEWEWTKDFAKVRENCHNTIVSVKEIGPWFIKVPWLFKALGKNFKLIYLVRDPRNWVSSWTYAPSNESITLYHEWKLDNTDFLYDMRTYCPSVPEPYLHYENLLSDLKAPPHKRMAAKWFADNSLALEGFKQLPPENALMVSLEKIQLDPIGMVEKIYSFIGEPIPSSVSNWVISHTKEGKEGERYGLSRNATKLASAWSTRLTKEQITDIEQIAGDLLETFGFSNSH